MNDELMAKCIAAAQDAADYEYVDGMDWGTTEREIGNWSTIVDAVVKAAHPNASEEDLQVLLQRAAWHARNGTDEDVAISGSLKRCFDDLRGAWQPPGMHLS